MRIVDLPDDILVFLFSNFMSPDDLLNLTKTCKRFEHLIEQFNICFKCLRNFPFVDLNYPYGYSEYFKYRMLPKLQIDEQITDSFKFSSLFLTDANRLIWLSLNDVKCYEANAYQTKQLNMQHCPPFLAKQKFKSIRTLKSFEIFPQNDIKHFLIKDNVLLNMAENELVVHLIENKNNDTKQFKPEDFNLRKLCNFKEEDYVNKINCADYSNKYKKLVYGSSNGNIKVFDLNEENNDKTLMPLNNVNLEDRVLRCVFSPSMQKLAVGSAAVLPYSKNHDYFPLRIFDFESLKEIQLLKPSEKRGFQLGAGVLALSYIDENTLMSSGYDTFIRIFDLRSNQCVQELEEPEDMSIYCVCTSKHYGLLSGNSGQSIIRYWDRRKNRVITTFNASNNKSSIYSLASTPETIYAAWDFGITSIDFT